MNVRAKISAIAAIGTKTRALGKDNDLIWKIPEDLHRFKDLTFGHPIIMGRKTYESIGRPLPGRMNIIVTRDRNYHQENCVVVHSVEDAIAKARDLEKEEIFIIGGGEIFTQSLPQTDRLYLTLVDDDTEGNAYFPEYPTFTKKVFEEKHEFEGLPYTYLTLEK